MIAERPPAFTVDRGRHEGPFVQKDRRAGLEARDEIEEDIREMAS
jgi:hypothetical protein